MREHEDQVSFTRIIGPPEPGELTSVPDPGERPVLWLRARLGDERSYELDRPQVRIGRRSDNEIVLSGPTVSSRHAVVRLDAGRAVIEDEGSLNGTFRNGERVEQAQLEAGDRIQIGPHLLVFVPARG